MKIKGLLFDILLTFVLTLVATGIVTLLWNLLIEKTGAIVDWKTSFIFAIIIGLVIPISRHSDKTK